ncbi:hypothetical protein LZ554_009550 [Drepanopeziza brunnea f. sp. 'monogermtubi']|nr:hypothetical protein LZ554_009550 [Drepanopeziza brunnea f. sp. 'monogermtubi']
MSILDLDLSNLKKEFRAFKITRGIFKRVRIAKDMPKATESNEVKLEQVTRAMEIYRVKPKATDTVKLVP